MLSSDGTRSGEASIIDSRFLYLQEKEGNAMRNTYTTIVKDVVELEFYCG
jgi:hypothetical protein